MTNCINFTKHYSKDFSTFDMGDIVIRKDGLTISSSIERGNSMMIFIAISDFVFTLKKIKFDVKRYEFIGADSSFCLDFERQKKGVLISNGTNKIQMDWLEIFLLTMNGLIEIRDRYINEVSRNDAVFQDLVDAEKCLTKLLCAEMKISGGNL